MGRNKSKMLIKIISVMLIAWGILILIPQVQSVVIMFAEKFVLHRALRKPDKWHQILFFSSVFCFIITFIGNFLYAKPKYIRLFAYLFVCIFWIFRILEQVNHAINNTPNYEMRIRELEFLNRQIKSSGNVSFCLETTPGDFFRTQNALAPRKIVTNDTTTDYVIGYINDEIPQKYTLVSTTKNFKLYKKEDQ